MAAPLATAISFDGFSCILIITITTTIGLHVLAVVVVHVLRGRTNVSKPAPGPVTIQPPQPSQPAPVTTQQPLQPQQPPDEHPSRTPWPELTVYEQMPDGTYEPRQVRVWGHYARHARGEKTACERECLKDDVRIETVKRVPMPNLRLVAPKVDGPA